MTTDGNLRNADELAEVLKGYNVHVFNGHTHYFENSEVTPTLYEHNIGAACGAWWGRDGPTAAEHPTATWWWTWTATS